MVKHMWHLDRFNPHSSLLLQTGTNASPSQPTHKPIFNSWRFAWHGKAKCSDSLWSENETHRIEITK
jgi:hypothetical protein